MRYDRKQREQRKEPKSMATKSSRFSQDPPLFDLASYKSFSVHRPKDRLTQNDLRNAIALIEHLCSCHRAALEVPGISSALKRHPFVSGFDGKVRDAGIHCDHAYGFIEGLLRAAQRWCAEQIEESPPGESPKAIGGPSATPGLAGRPVKREARRLKQ
jgi:hypothetical protein